MDEDLGNKIYQQLMDMWIIPSVKKRQKEGILPDPLNIEMAQIIFCPEADEPIINVNDEVKIVAKVKLDKKNKINEGSEISSNDIENFESLQLNEEKFPNCGHATFIIHNNILLLDFDLTKYKHLSKKHLLAARQFIDGASFGLENGHLTSFVDNLFSTSELIAKSFLLRNADRKFAQKTNHRAVHSRYNQSASIGNVNIEYATTHNKLSGLRDKARYINGDMTLNSDEAKEYLDIIESAFKEAEKNVTSRFDE